jgi:C-terminal processing protease CtpA/Prc
VEIRKQGITPDMAINQLEAMRTTVSKGARPLSTNALSKHLKSLREAAAQDFESAQAATPAPMVTV